MKLDHETVDGAGPQVVVTVESDQPRELVVWRTSPAGTVKVRGGRVHVDGTAIVRDYECPLGVELTYWAADSQGSQADGPQRITVDSPTAWIHDADSPGDAVAASGDLVPGTLLVEHGTLASVSRPAGGTSVRVLGSRLPVRLGGGRQAPTDVELRLIAPTRTERDRLAALIDSGALLCVRGMRDEDWELPEVCWLAAEAASLSTVARYSDSPVWRAVLSGDLVRGPTRSIIVAAFSYDDMDEVADGRTYDRVDFEAGLKAMTYTDVDRDGRSIFA
ncbi:MAG: hypothetical protein Q3979_05620 [Actinomycetaceae bacterium]|nr:hypothetical protein [Actinomycetaceae bacterium]